MIFDRLVPCQEKQRAASLQIYPECHIENQTRLPKTKPVALEDRNDAGKQC